MKNEQKKRTEYFEQVKKELEMLEERRRTILNYRKKIVILAMVIGISVLYSLINRENLEIAFLLIILCIFGIIYLIKKDSLLYRSYKIEYKEKVVTPLIKAISDKLYYDFSSGIDERSFRNSKIFSENIESYYSEDLMRGKVGEIGVYFSRVIAQEYKNYESDRRVFDGIFFRADLIKNFESFTIIRHNNSIKTNKKIAKILNKFSELKLVEMENIEFENNFDVYSKNPIEARELLSPSIMEKILQVKKSLGYEIDISFSNYQIFITIHTLQNLLEPKFKEIYTELSYLYKYDDIVRSVVEIVEQLDLNTRIWSKK